MLTDRVFGDFQSLIARESGIWLAEGKRALLIGRLSRRLRELSLENFATYYRIVAADAEERVKMLDAITTNETAFFREPKQFDLLRDELCPAWEREAAAGSRPRKLRIWSAACSNGQEPYSLAMLLHEQLGLSGWHVDILASDLSTRVLDTARAAAWPEEKLAGIPRLMRSRYLPRGIMSPAIRGLVRFERINLLGTFPFSGKFDAIFCRNVLIYFDRPTRERVISRLLEHLAPGGYLFLGHAESLAGTSFRLASVMPAVYRNR